MSAEASLVAPDRSTGRRRAAVAVVLIAVFMSNLDLWVVNVAITAIGRDLPGSSLGGLSWVINGYSIALAALLIVAGRAADRYGVTRIFQAGLIVFTLASALCAVAPDLVVLVVFRVLQGIGGAMVTTASLSLLLRVTEPERRAHAVRDWAAVGALAAATGPTIGGLLVTLDWRWVFLINLPIGIVAIVLTAVRAPKFPGRAGVPHPDLLSALLLSIAVAALVASIVQLPDQGLTLTTAIVVLVLVLATGLFVLRSRKHANPLIAPVLFRLRGFPTVNAAMLIFSAGFGIMLLSNSLWLQNVWHFGPVLTGLAMAPGPLMVPVTTAILRRFGRRVRPIVFVAAGGLVFGAGMVWGIVMRSAEVEYATVLLPQLIAGGVGIGLAIGNLLATGSALLPDEHSGAGSGVLNTARQIGASVGVAVIVTSLAATGQSILGFDIAWAVAAACGFALAVLALALARASGGRGVS
ncbi:MFS transporter [Leifsonia virtsii]|uniref:MFS transporter n=1 Tax=Leifsonia virtsii TaxID=3035915 RepID=A0ABT8IXU2_9MICO|nr:MFS transporter [Leifsonia virtsii]MDN4596849.1 MFS transporter [Leifsonia virtsii]